MHTLGEKVMWCKHGGPVSGTDLESMFSNFKKQYCEGWEYHSPRSNDWTCTFGWYEDQIEFDDLADFLVEYEEKRVAAACFFRLVRVSKPSHSTSATVLDGSVPSITAADVHVSVFVVYLVRRADLSSWSLILRLKLLMFVVSSTPTLNSAPTLLHSSRKTA